jgi:hypothetical protein
LFLKSLKWKVLFLSHQNNVPCIFFFQNTQKPPFKAFPPSPDLKEEKNSYFFDLHFFSQTSCQLHSLHRCLNSFTRQFSWLVCEVWLLGRHGLHLSAPPQHPTSWTPLSLMQHPSHTLIKMRSGFDLFILPGMTDVRLNYTLPNLAFIVYTSN